MTTQFTGNATAGIQTSLDVLPSARSTRHVRPAAKRMPLLASTALIPVAGVLALFPGAAYAQDVTWDGETSTDWATGTNWDGNLVPGPGGTVFINNGTLPNQPRVNTNQTAAQTNVSAGVLTVAATLTSPVAISGSGVVNVVSGGNVVGNISVASGGSLQTSGTGAPIILSAPITLNGSGASNGGALRNVSGTSVLTGNITLGSATRIVSDAGLLQINGATNNGGHLLTLSGAAPTAFVGAISGNGGLTVEGPGQVDLNGVNTYAGITTVNSGILLANNGAGIIDTGQVVVNGGAFGIGSNETIGSLAGNGGFVSTSAGAGTTTLTVGGNNLSTTYAGNTQNNGPTALFAINKIGTGTLTLTGNIAHTGGTTVSAGTLEIGNGGTTGTISGNITNNSALVFNRSNAFTVGGIISGSGSLTKQGAGNMTLSGANTYAGITVVSAGTLTVTNAQALGTGANGTVVANGATLHLLGAFDNTTEAVTINGFGVGNAGALRSSGGSNGFSATAVTLGSDARINSDDELSLNSVIGGGNALTLGGTGRLFINNNMSGVTTLTTDGTGIKFIRAGGPTGETTVNAGVLVVDTAGSLADTALVTINSAGTLRYGISDTIGGLTGSGILEVLGGTLTLGGNNASTTFTGILGGGGGGLTKAGTGTFTITGSNFRSGITTISGGTLQVGNGGTGGALGSGEVVNNAALVFDRSDAFSIGNTINGSGSLTKRGSGTLTLTGANGYTGGTTIETGTLVLGQASGGVIGAAGTGQINLGNGTVLRSNVTGTLSNRIAITSGNSATIGAANATTLTLASGSLDLLGGAGTTVTFGSSDMTGTVILDPVTGSVDSGSAIAIAGGTVRLSDNIAAAFFNFAGGGTTVGTGMTSATFDTNGIAVSVSNLGGSSAGVITNTGAAASTLSVRNLQTSTYAGTITNGASALNLIKQNGAALILTGNNTYTGTTTISAGTLQIGNGGTTGSLGSGTVTIGTGATLAYNRSDFLAQTATIAGAGSLIMAGTGVLELNRANLYDGATLINSGAVLLTNAAGLGSTLGGTTVSSGAQLALIGNFDLRGEALTLNGASVGALNNASGTSLVGSITLGSDSQIIGQNGSLTISTIEGQGNALITTGNGAITVSGVISNLSALNKIGNGILTLNGANTYAGVTTVSGGTLVVGNASALGTTAGNTIVASGATLRLFDNITLAENITINGNGVGGGGALRAVTAADVTGAITLGSTARIHSDSRLLTITGAISGANHDLTIGGNGSARITSSLALGTGNLIKEGGADLTLTGDNSTGYVTTTISAGILQIGNGGTTGTLGSGNVVNNGTLSFNRSNDITVANTISGVTGVIGKIGAGKLILTGNNSYGGGTAVFSGILAAGSNTALGTGLLAMRGGGLQLGVASSPGVSAGPITLGNNILLFGNTTIDLVGETAGVNSFNGSYNSTGTTATLNGVISNFSASQLTINGAGRLTLNGNNTYTGGTVISQALVEVGHANAFGTGAVTLGASAALRNTTAGALTLANNLAATGIAVTIGGTSDITLTGNLSGTGNLSKVQGNTLTIAGAVNDFGGALTVNGGTVLVNGVLGNAGAVVNVGNLASLGVTAILGGTGTIAGTVNVNNGGTLAAGQSPGTLTVGTLNLNSGSTTSFELGEAGVAGGANNDLIRVTGNLALNGGGISVVRGTGFSAGQYTLFEFGTLSGAIGNMTLNPIGGGFGGSLALGTGTVLLNVAGAADQVHWNGSTFAPAGTIVGGNGTWNLTSTNFSNAAGNVSGPWAGNGALAIFGGENAGTVTIADDLALAPSGLVFETDGYTITGGNAASVLSFAGPTGISTASAVGATIDVRITGAGSVTKTGAGTLLLTGANNYAGDTMIMGGTLQIGNGGTTGTLGGGNVVNNGALVFNRSDDIGIANVISGTGSVTKQGTGTLLLSGANSYDGLTTVAAGTLLVNNLAGLGSAVGGTVVDAGATLAFSTGLAMLVDEDITINGTGVGGAGALQGRGGSVQIGRTVQLGSDSLIGVTAGSLNLGGITGTNRNLTIGGAGLLGINGDLAIGSGTLIKNGTGQASLFGTNSWTGDLIINDGTVQVSFAGGPVNRGIGDNANVTINSGLLVLAQNETIGSLTGGATGFVDDASAGRTLTVGGNNASTTFAGRINGTLGLTKVGTGTLTLSGSGSATTGVTRISGGTLALGANDAISNGSAVVIAGGTLALGTFSDTVARLDLLSGSITGGTGSALTVTGNYSQSGGTLAAGATVNVGSPFGLSGGTIAGTLASTLVSNSAGLVSGTGVLVTGRLTMVGNLNVGSGAAGGLTINSGGVASVRETAIGAGASGMVTVSGAGSRLENTAGLLVGFATNGSLNVESGGFVRSASSIIGAFQSGTAVVRGTGSRWETTGILTIATNSAGTLTVEDGGFVSSGSAIVGANAAGVGAILVSGSGSRWENAGELLLGRNGSGTLTIAAGGAVTAGSVVMAREAGSTGTLIFGAAEGSPAVAAGTLTTPTIAFGAGTGAIIFNHTSADLDLAAAISGNGTVRHLAGTTTLSGASTYTGTTSVLGGTLRVTGSLASDIGITGGTLVNAGAIAGAVTNAGLVTNTGTIGGTVTNTGTVTSTGTLAGGLINSAGAAASISGVLSGAVSNSGTITLTGATTGSGAFTQTDTGVFNLAGNAAAIGSLAGAGQVQLGSGTLTTGSDNAATTFAGIISGSGGGLTKVGTGTLTLTGVNTYSGTTTVNAGTLAIAAGARIAGNAVNAATLDNAGTIGGSVTNNGSFTNTGSIGGALINNAGASATSSGTVTGAATNAGTLVSTGTLGGGLTNSGTAQVRGVLTGNVANSGTLTLTGTTTGIATLDQSAGGIFNLGGFATTLGALSGAGSVSLGTAGLTVGGLGSTTTFGGQISGSGGLTKVGSGTLVLSGANAYGGGTTISGGTLQLGAGGTSGSITGPVANNGVLALNRSDMTTFASIISGSGMVVHSGTGTTTLTGANNYTGGTLVTRGRLFGNTASLQGLIQVDTGALIGFVQGTGGTFAGQLTGAGVFEKSGTGLLTLTGNSNGLTGATNVRGGELRVNGSLAGSVVTLDAGTTLSGTGVIGGLVALSGSTVAPGTSPGTLSVAGNVTLAAGSTSVFEVSASGPSDLIIATGTARLGGTAALVNLGGTYAFNTELTLVQANGGRTGTFDAFTTSGFGIIYRPELVYTGGQMRLRMAANSLANIVGGTSALAALTANQRAVVGGIDAAVAAGYNPQPLFAVYSLPTAQLANAFDQLSGEVYATAAGVGIGQERLVREAVLGRLSSTAMLAREAPGYATGLGVWGQIYGGWGEGDQGASTAAFDADRMGFVTGLDYGTASDTGSWRAGLFGMQVQSDVTITARGSAAEVEQVGGGAYAAITSGGFGAALGGYLAEVDLRAFRDIALPGFADNLVGNTEGKSRQAFAELSYTLEAGAAQIRPFVAGSIGRFTLDGLTERGGAAALAMREQRYDTGSVTGGIDARIPVGKVLRLGGMLAARRQLGDRDPQALLALAAAPQQTFAIEGAQLDRTALAARLDAAFQFDENVAITIGYNGLIGKTQTDHNAAATISVRF